MYSVFPSPIDTNYYPCMKRGPLEKQCERDIFVNVLVDISLHKLLLKINVCHQIVKYTKNYQFKYVYTRRTPNLKKSCLYRFVIGIKTSDKTL